MKTEWSGIRQKDCMRQNPQRLNLGEFGRKLQEMPWFPAEISQKVLRAALRIL